MNVKYDFTPQMTPSMAAKTWMLNNECSSNGDAAIETIDGQMSVNYQITRYGITILCKDGTAIPVPYRYDGTSVELI